MNDSFNCLSLLHVKIYECKMKRCTQQTITDLFKRKVSREEFDTDQIGANNHEDDKIVESASNSNLTDTSVDGQDHDQTEYSGDDQAANSDDDQEISDSIDNQAMHIDDGSNTANCNLTWDIKDYIKEAPNDQVKYYFIKNRQPGSSYKFPFRRYKDKRRKGGIMNRRCGREWFDKYKFICYSKRQDAIYCVACVFFPDSAYRRANNLISEPYHNWKDALENLKKHASHDYHLDSMAKLTAFVATHEKPDDKISAIFSEDTVKRVKENRTILASVVKSVLFCGRQGIALRSHRDDDTCSSFNKGNFKELLKVRVDAGDKPLEDHLAHCKKNASYTSKTSQNELLFCIKQYIQDAIVKEINKQAMGPYYGIQVDEVTDSSNWEQLGLVLRYTLGNGQPVEKLLEFIPCEQIDGKTLCQSIIKSLTDAGLDVQYCRSMTTDGAGNMAGRHNGCAALFAKESPRAAYHYCASHDLNLALCKSCNIKEIHNMLDSLMQLGIFFKFSAKRSRRLEAAIDEINTQRVDPKLHIKKSKFSVFCDTRWADKHTTLHDFDDLYEPLVVCLEAVGSLESGWGSKATSEAYGLLKRITDATFIACFQTVLHFFGYTRGLCVKLQGSSLDILQGYQMVVHVNSMIVTARQNEAEYDRVYGNMCKMADITNSPLQIPRRCGRQTQRNNVPAETVKQYFKRAVFIPFVDSLVQQFEMRFGHLIQQAIRAMTLIPRNIPTTLENDTVNSVFDYYKDDLPHPETFHQEVQIWNRMWQSTEDKPFTLAETLSHGLTCTAMYPNISKIIFLLLLTSVTSCSVERANSSLKFVKNYFRSTMGEDRFNALMLLYVHKDIEIDIEKVIDIYANRHPRRMNFINPLSEEIK